MRLLITGIGDAFTARHFGTSAVIDAPDGLVLIDCPDLVHRAVREAAERAAWVVDSSMIDDIILTHLHGDHCNGLESFGFTRRLARADGQKMALPRVHTVPAVADRLWERLAPAMDAPFGNDTPSQLEDYFDIHLLSPDVPTTIAGLTVACRPTQHVVPTIGLRLADEEGELGWSGDTAFDPEHIRWLAGADLIVHESNKGPWHTPIADLEGLEPELRERLRLVHLPDDFDPASTTLPCLAEGDVLEVVRRP